jgi:erythromycin esterase-like protein
MEENIKNKIYNSQKWKTFLEAAKTRCSDTENNTYKQEFVEFMRKYEEEHKNDLSESLYYYDVATSERFFEECYLLLDI